MSPQFVQNILSAYPAIYAPKHWAVLESSAGFSGAKILRLETAVGVFCLRGWPGPGLPSHRIAGLHRLLQHVFEAGVSQVAVPVRASSGETLVRCRDRDWQLEPWMPGLADFWRNPSTDRLKSAMACLARFHQATLGYSDVGPAMSWFHCQERAPSPAVGERLDTLRKWQNGKLAELRQQLSSVADRELRDLGCEFAAGFEKLAPRIGYQLELLSHLRFSLQPCLRDVWHDHMLFTGDEVTGLIDASACRTENVATDLARLLGSFVGDDRAAWAVALEAYETHRPLTPDERALVQGLDHSGVLLSGMAWLDRLVLQKEHAPQLAKVLERLKALRDRLRFLDAVFSGNTGRGSIYVP